MARPRRLDELREDAYKRADGESDDLSDRHPPEDVTRYINQGGAELRDLIIEARGRTFFRKDPPQVITTVSGQTRYPLEPDFYRLISIRFAGPGGFMLDAFTSQEEPTLRERGFGGGKATHYELQDGYIEILPKPEAGLTYVLDYISVYEDLEEDDDELDGFNGWEEYPVVYAARCMALKDEEWERAKALDADLNKLRARIQRLAPHRDAFRAEQVKDTRQTRLSMGRAGRWGGRW